MDNNKISVGDIVFSRWQNAIVLHVDDYGEALVCPIVYAVEAEHRADYQFEWYDLVYSGLARLDIKCRAIPLRRRIKDLEYVGHIDLKIVKTIKAIALREHQVREQEMLNTRKGKKRFPCHIVKKTKEFVFHA
ncbi:hypothetical protein [Swingsia samuiensis]|uniref:Type II toxin-antitoxin system PemK/MazF family toxin n=1 Tax=Swingsia samuiensis TaxID=1293412 RepID=A0A4Y6UIB9_9PROT|nr:hypothetical protein [Swingsia samuiensis]QDH16794.1 hypothetical protein E3D00_03830 [Swingsia samuiensis]